MSGKSCSVQNPEGIRRMTNGHTLAPRSQRKTKLETESYMAWFPTGPGKNDGSMRMKTIEKKVSLVFLD